MIVNLKVNLITGAIMGVKEDLNTDAGTVRGLET